MIGGALTEINVTSPTCFQEIDRLNGVHLERQVIDFVEKEVKKLRRGLTGAFKHLVLYHFEACPYCVRVREYIEANDLDIPYRDIRLDSAAAEELGRVGGKTQVPCLFIEGKPLYESEDIIRYLEEKIVRGSKQQTKQETKQCQIPSKDRSNSL